MFHRSAPDQFIVIPVYPTSAPLLSLSPVIVSTVWPVEDKCNLLAGLAVPIPTSPLLVAKLAPVVLLNVVAATVLGVVAPSVPFIAAPVRVLFVSVWVLVAVVMLLGVMIEESVAIS